MAYFNHAFQKVFVGTAGFTQKSGGKLGTTGNILTKGQFGFVYGNGANAWEFAPIAPDPALSCCPLVLVSGSIYQKDKIGPFHGGYTESNKSKMINPRYVNKFYRVDPCVPQAATVSVGNTPDTFELASDSSTWAIPGQTNCAPDFLCGETYYLRLDLKGSPILRFLSRNSYFTASAYTGCCSDPEAITPALVDPTIVYIAWAKQFLTSPLINPFIQIEVFDSSQTSLGLMTKDNVNVSSALWNTYVPIASPVTGDSAGIYITGAYVDTQFGDCTFYPTDALQSYLEPVKIYASEVDLNGDPCAFASLCVANTCLPIQGAGFGETVVRELILSEGYSQSPFYTGTDLRIREITQGYDVTTTINRTAQYTRYYLLHSVPRFNNPSSTFDNDQYLLEIIGNPTATTVATANNIAATVVVANVTNIQVGQVVSVAGGGYSTALVTIVNPNTNTVTFSGTVAITEGDSLFFIDPNLVIFETFVTDWLADCNDCSALDTFTCPAACVPLAEFPVD